MTELEEAQLRVLHLMMRNASPHFIRALQWTAESRPQVCAPTEDDAPDATVPLEETTTMTLTAYESLRANADRYVKLRDNLTRLIIRTHHSNFGIHRVIEEIDINPDLPPPDLDSVDRAVDLLKT